MLKVSPEIFLFDGYRIPAIFVTLKELIAWGIRIKDTSRAKGLSREERENSEFAPKMK